MYGKRKTTSVASKNPGIRSILPRRERERRENEAGLEDERRVIEG